MTALHEYEAALQFMNEGDDYLVVSHVQPDGDAVSSTLAVAWLLKALGKSVVMANEDEIPQRLQFMSGSERIERYSTSLQRRKFSRIVAVDCADFSRMGRMADWFEEGYQLLNIDHHPRTIAMAALILSFRMQQRPPRFCLS